MARYPELLTPVPEGNVYLSSTTQFSCAGNAIAQPESRVTMAAAAIKGAAAKQYILLHSVLKEVVYSEDVQ